MATTELFDEDDAPTGAQLHAERTAGLSEAEKTVFNDGYLYASADAIEVMSRILDEDGFTDSDRVQAFEHVVGQMSVPLLIASLASGKNFLK